MPLSDIVADLQVRVAVAENAIEELESAVKEMKDDSKLFKGYFIRALFSIGLIIAGYFIRWALAGGLNVGH